jgi:uroporphyrinogen III methyltransferase/synthase
VYEQADAVDPAAEVLDRLRRGEVRFVTLTSPNDARALLRACDDTTRGRILRGEISLVAISPVTGAAVRELGLPVAATADAFTTEGVIDALVRLVRACGNGSRA